MTDHGAQVWVVDRVEGRTIVLVEDATGRTVEVDAGRLGAAAAEPHGGAGEPAVAEDARGGGIAGLEAGAVLRVPEGPDGEPVWAEAVIDEDARRARVEEAERLLDELKRRDPGGDVVL